MPSSFRDHRGLIEDVLPGPIDMVTRIFTRAGQVRGNHTHELTEQFTYVVSGRMTAVQQTPSGHLRRIRLEPGQLLHEPAGMPHAWQAQEDTTVLVFTRGPRSGDAYETDTRRLGSPLITPPPPPAPGRKEP